MRCVVFLSFVLIGDALNSGKFLAQDKPAPAVKELHAGGVQAQTSW